MVKFHSSDLHGFGELEERAFNLAFFLVPDLHKAFKITALALSKANAAEKLQDRRITQRKRRRTDTIRRVSVGYWNLVQRLVCIEAESIWADVSAERQESHSEMAIQFVTHLVRLGAARSSFHLGVAIGRVLYRQSTADNVKLLEALSVPGAVRYEDEYRRCKRWIMNMMVRRFPQLEITEGARGETQFNTTTSGRAIALAWETLERMTPWGTHCTEVPPAARETASLIWSDELAEESRFHHLLHPPCFSRAAANLRQAMPVLHIPATPTTASSESTVKREWELTPTDKLALVKAISDESARASVSLY